MKGAGFVSRLFFSQSIACLHDQSKSGFSGLGTHLFLKVPRTGDSEVTFSVFESSCHLLLPV